MAKSTAYKFLAFIDHIDDQYGFDQSFLTATEHMRDHIQDNYPEEDKQKES